MVQKHLIIVKMVECRAIATSTIKAPWTCGFRLSTG